MFILNRDKKIFIQKFKVKKAFEEERDKSKIVNRPHSPSSFCSSIDSKIEQVQKQLNFTKEFKKALLQKMFI